MRWCILPWSILPLKMAMMGQSLCITWNFEMFGDRLRAGLRNGITALTLKDFSYWPEIWWDDVHYHEAYFFSKWLCWANFVHSRELGSCHTVQDRFGTGLKDDVTAPILEGFQLSAWNLMEWCTVFLLVLASIHLFICLSVCPSFCLSWMTLLL